MIEHVIKRATEQTSKNRKVRRTETARLLELAVRIFVRTLDGRFEEDGTILRFVFEEAYGNAMCAKSAYGLVGRSCSMCSFIEHGHRTCGVRNNWSREVPLAPIHPLQTRIENRSRTIVKAKLAKG